MARIRNIKPDFFKNEEIGLLDHTTRLVFIGLWTLADRCGKLLDRPNRIKAELFPYEDVDIEKSLSALTDTKFIKRYHKSGLYIIKVITFNKHQRIQGTELKSVSILPDEDTNELLYDSGDGSILEAPRITGEKDNRIKDNRIKEEKDSKEISSSSRKDVISVSDFVFLTQKEIDRLKSEFGEKGYSWLVARLDGYKGQSKKNKNKYDDDNRAIRGWVLTEYKKNGGGGGQQGRNLKDLN